MRRLGLVLIVLGACFLLSGMMVSQASTVQAKTVNAPHLPPEGAKFVGSTTCFTCHSNEHRNWTSTLHSKVVQDVSVNAKAVVADFAAGADVRTVDGKAYEAKDIAFTLGSKSQQRYIAKTDKGYQVLPGLWDVKTKTWVKAAGADWLKDCAGCHTTGFDVKAGTFSEIAVACEACHGPGSVHAEKAKALKAGTNPVSDDVYAVRQAIVKTTDATVCAQCHNQGTSADKQHPYPVGYVVGGPLDSSMFIPNAPTGKADDPNFWADGHEKAAYGTFTTWSLSKHGTALKDIRDAGDHAGDYCLPCHSSDYAKQDKTFAQDAVTLKNVQFTITCVMCHAPHGEAHLADQLTVESYTLCVSCHNATGLEGKSPIVAGNAVHHPMREMFEGQKFLGVGPVPSKHYSNEANGPICSSCHMVSTAKNTDSLGAASHTLKVVLPNKAEKGEADSCSKCHTLEKNKDNTPDNLAAKVEKVQKDTKKRVEGLKEDLKTILADHKDWKADAKPADKPKEQQAYDRAVTLVSFVESDGSWGFHNPDYTDVILKEAQKVVDGLLK